MNVCLDHDCYANHFIHVLTSLEISMISMTFNSFIPDYFVSKVLCWLTNLTLKREKIAVTNQRTYSFKVEGQRARVSQ